MRTVKQIKASRRNFTIMYLVGVLTMLNYIDSQLRNFVIRGQINVIRNNIKVALMLIKETNYEHSFYSTTQKDVKYECKESDSQSDAK